jgi:DNA polymerase III delta prime subunit
MENFMLKFQPLYFSDFEIDKNIIDILDTLIKINNINILFIGDIGSGKTSLLNALVREYYQNVEPKVYLENILHINNLKEQGINYYRTEVKTFCQTGSTIKDKKKIIMLDDIDFINEQSQQVFRNCMDKFNNNVHFIASSGNIQKVIESLQSRFIIIKLNQLQKVSMSKILTKIKISKNINITPEAENFILDISNNSAKKLINYMEKIKLLNDNITFENATQICTDISFLKLEEYSCHIKNKRLCDAVTLIYSIYDNGYSVIDILDNYFTFVKITNIFKENEKYEIISYICKYITIFYNIHEDEIELSLITNNLINLLG